MADEREIVNVERALTALREACALLDKRRHPGFAESCATPGCGCPVCAFVAHPHVRLLAGEPEPVLTQEEMGRIIAESSASYEPAAQTEAGAESRVPFAKCPDCACTPTETGGEDDDEHD